VVCGHESATDGRHLTTASARRSGFAASCVSTPILTDSFSKHHRL
jgi:hypothetical protein